VGKFAHTLLDFKSDWAEDLHRGGEAADGRRQAIDPQAYGCDTKE
jgi:hypothetical protein